MTSKRQFLTWISHRRTHGLCAPLELQLVEITSSRKGLIRYMQLIPRTILHLIRHQPQLLVVQSPSIVLAFITVMLKPLLRYKLAIDAHNEAVEPYIHNSPAMHWLTRLAIRRSDCVIVTNSALATIVKAKGGHPVILPDPLPATPAVGHFSRQPAPEFKIAVICTYASDEPVAAIVAAAARLDPDCRFFITGNHQRLDPAIKRQIGRNVELTGYLDEDEYWRLLLSADAVMDLSLMANCLVCGAYEGIAAGRPLILSDDAATRDLFGNHAEFTSNDADGIVAATRKLMDRYEDMMRQLPQATHALAMRWEKSRIEALEALRS